MDGPTPSPPPRARRLAGVTVLVVEDHDDSRDAMCQMLESLGATVSAARDGAEALALARRHHPDVILCDLVMPAMDGFGVLSGLRRDLTLRDTPVIAISGLGTDRDRMRTLAAGFEAHLLKPVDCDTIVCAVARVLPIARRVHRSR